MRKWILGIVGVLALVIAPMAAVAEQPSVEVEHASSGPVVLLRINNAAGQVFFVTDCTGCALACGVVPSNSFTIPVIGAGPVLTVRVGTQITYFANDWWIWQ